MRRPAAVLLAGLALALAAWVALSPGGPGPAPRGNAVIVLNAGSRGLDSIVVAADPPGAHGLAGRHGYLAPRDSALVALPAGRGDVEVRAWRNGRVVADHVALLGGRSLFEVRVGDSADAGRYRRTD